MADAGHSPIPVAHVWPSAQRVYLIAVVTLVALTFAVQGRELIRAQYTAMSKMSQEIFLQEEMESSLRDTFGNLFENFMNKSAVFSKTFTYVCDKPCASTFSYEYGLTAAFLLAVLSDRKFSIYPNLDSPFYDLYDESVYQWKERKLKTEQTSTLEMIHPAYPRRQYLAEVHLIEKEISKMDFDEHFKANTIYLSGNYDWILDLRRHGQTARKIPWLFTTHASDLIRLIHNGLFRLPQRLEEILNDELIQKVNEHRLVCFHSDNEQFKNKIHTFLEFVSRTFTNDSMIYISGIDKLDMFINAYRPELRNLILKVNEGNVRQTFTENGHLISQKNLEILINLHILKMCDTLVLTESPLGMLAARLRRREDNLYCYRTGVIFPCKRRLIAGSFREKANKLEYIDPNFYCKHSGAEKCAHARHGNKKHKIENRLKKAD